VTYDEFVDIKELDDKYTYQKSPAGKVDIIKSLFDEPSQGDSSIRSDFFTHKSGAFDSRYYANRDIFNNEVYSHPVDLIISEATRLPASLRVFNAYRNQSCYICSY